MQRLDEALRLVQSEPREAAPSADLAKAVLIELGDCWQHLRQFVKALDYYERAIADPTAAPTDSPVAESAHGELWKLAHYRSGVLAAALGKIGLARQRLAEVVRADKMYKDVSERLDKLPAN